MSYDIRLGVKVADDCNLFAVIAEPELSSPTYNLRNMFVACMDWDYAQSKWYNVADVLPKIRRGIAELQEHPDKYKRYNAPNGWGTVSSALDALKSLYQCILDNSAEASRTWNEIPFDMMYMRW